MQLAFRARGLANTFPRGVGHENRFRFLVVCVGLDNTHADVRNHWEYPIELGGVWKF
jgi:hypothetical protein